MSSTFGLQVTELSGFDEETYGYLLGLNGLDHPHRPEQASMITRMRHRLSRCRIHLPNNPFAS